jgi:pimeloyl-ACP methyl ester carboxylesterase
MLASKLTFEGFEGLKLAADVWGDGDARPVLFLHGGGQTRHSWGSTAKIVAEHGWRAIALDLRGHGDSEWAANGNYSFNAFGADCVAVVEQLGQTPVIVGASLGGISALLAERMSDHAVSAGLVLVDIAPQANLEGVNRIRNFMMSGIDGFETLEDAANAIRTYTPQRIRRTDTESLKKVLRFRCNRWYWHWDPQTIIQLPTEIIAGKLDGLLEFALGNIAVPTLLVRGAMSDVVTEEGIEHLRSRIPQVKIVDVAGAAHMIAGDQNDAFSEAVVHFISESIGDPAS